MEELIIMGAVLEKVMRGHDCQLVLKVNSDHQRPPYPFLTLKSV